MRKLLIILFVLLLASPLLMAQERTGNIYGKILDEDGNPIPGVTVTLTGSKTAPLTSITSAEGIYRFVSLAPAEDYTVTAKLEGFKTETRQNIIVRVGAKVEINLTMEMGALEEEVTVTATTPVVEEKSTEVGQNVTREVLQSLPTARDPWVIMEMAPGVLVDRENVGGNQSGQQSGFAARGSPSDAQTVWNLDGMVITDDAAIGASPIYWDFDAFEEMNVTVGGSDVTTQTGGLSLNLVTRRGGDRVSLGGRFYLTDRYFQLVDEDWVEEKKEEEPRFHGINKIRNIKDYGFNMGGPVWKDHVWLWGSVGVQDLKTDNVYGSADDTLLQNYVGKINVQVVPENRFEAFIHVGAKNKYGRGAAYDFPGGFYQKGWFHFGNPIIKFQDEHMFGSNLFISAKYALTLNGFSLTPMDDKKLENIPFWDATNRIYKGPAGNLSYWEYACERPVGQYTLRTTYFNDDLFGASHEVLAGIEYADRDSRSSWVSAGNMWADWNLNYPVADLRGNDGVMDIPESPYFMMWGLDRNTYWDTTVQAYAAYLRDTITIGNLNVLVGLRYDIQRPGVNPMSSRAVDDNPAWDHASSAVKSAMSELLPENEVEKTMAVDYKGDTWLWQTFSPRIGITWDIFGTGKTVAKLNFSRYGNFMGQMGDDWCPGGLGGWMNFFWKDNGDLNITQDELYWFYISEIPEGKSQYSLYHVFDEAGKFAGNWDDAAGWFWGGYEHENPKKTVEPYTSYDPEVSSPITYETMLTLEQEVSADVGVTLNLSYRRYTNYNWDRKYFEFEDGNYFRSRDWYVSAGSPPADFSNLLPEDIRWTGDTGESSEHAWYYANPEYSEGGHTWNPAKYSPWERVEPRPERYQQWWGFDLIFNKRLSNRWMLNGSFTYQIQKEHWGTEGRWEDTNMWARNDRVYSPFQGGASGKIDQYTFSPWMVKLSGLYQLPYGVNISGTFVAREGWLIREGYTLHYFGEGYNPRDNSQYIYIAPFGSEHLPTFYKVDLRLEKIVKIGDRGRIYLMADLFNALNSKIENRRAQKDWGDLYYYGPNNPNNHFRKNNLAWSLNEVLNPLCLRVGIRFEI